jgi:cytoskeletal protein CcmA (bactofilin family)
VINFYKEQSMKNITVNYLFLAITLSLTPSTGSAHHKDPENNLLAAANLFLEEVALAQNGHLTQITSCCNANKEELLDSLEHVTHIIEDSPEVATPESLQQLNRAIGDYLDIHPDDDDSITKGYCKKIKKSLNVQGNAHFCKNVEVDGNLTVNGTLIASPSSLIINELTIGNCTGLTGDVTVGGNLNVCNAVNIGGDLSVEGTLNVCSQDLCCVLQNRPSALFIGTYTTTPAGIISVTFPPNYFTTGPTSISAVTSAQEPCVLAITNDLTTSGCEIITTTADIACAFTGATVNLIVVGYPGTGYCPIIS